MLIEQLPSSKVAAAVALWHDAGLTRPWNDPLEDLRRALADPASTVLAGTEDGTLVATAIVGGDGHRGWVYYLAVRADARGRGHGTEMMRACERWLAARGIPKVNVMVRADNDAAQGFYARLGYSADDVAVFSRRLD